MITFHLFVLSCFYSLLLCCAMLICSVMSNSFRPHGWQSTRILCPRGFSGQRMLGWVAMPSSRWSSQSRDRTQVSCIAGGFFTDWATREAQSLLLHAIKTHSSVQSLSPVQLFATPWTAAHQASLSITNYRSLLKLMSIVGDAIQPSHPRLSPFPLAFNLSQHQGLLKWVSSSHQVAKVLEFEFQHHSF